MNIRKVSEEDSDAIVSIGKISVGDAHKESCPPEDMNDYLEKNYSKEAIEKELSNAANIYHLIHYNNNPVGFSKIVLNAEHANIPEKNATKLDRIYLLKEFQGLKLGQQLLNFNIDLAKHNNQSGMWLFTWIGNKKAIDFYTKAGFTIIGKDLFKVSETHYNEQYQMFLPFNKLGSIKNNGNNK